MLNRLSKIALATALGAATFAIHIDTSSAQAPRPRNERTFEFGEGRNLPFNVERSGRPTERFQFYRNGWWYEEPFWLGGSPYGSESTQGFRVYGSGPIADPYPRQDNFSSNKPVGF